MAFGKPTPEAEAPLATRIHLINLDLRGCNSVADVVELLAKISDEELLGLQTAFRAAQPGRSSLELARLHGIRMGLTFEVSRRQLDDRKAELDAIVAAANDEHVELSHR